MVADKPHLFIVAGPNGAGKSLFSAMLAPTEFDVFDGDKYITELKKRFPEIGSDILQERVNEHDFKMAKEVAIKAHKSFAFETNFSAEDPLQSLREFKSDGYLVHLIFIGLNTLEECIQRVSSRVKAGGHKVSEPSIEYNFKHGYENLYNHFHHFDTVTLLDNSIVTDQPVRIPVKMLYWEKGNIELFDPNCPDWVGKFITLNKNKYQK